MDLAAVKAEFQGQVFDELKVTPDAQALAIYAQACGEQSACFIDPADPDFQAPPTYASSIHAGQRYPKGFPKFSGLGMDGGKAVTNHVPIRAGVEITARSHIHDLYVKSGRSGNMTFIVLRMDLYDPSETHLASADTSIVIREKPQKKSQDQSEDKTKKERS